jgi:GTP-binding protein
MTLSIALVGRENVGKSSIFNKLTSCRQKAIVHNKPGVTVDFNILPSEIGNIHFFVIDTPGGIKAFDKVTNLQLANAFILVIDNTCGIVAEDEKIIKQIRKIGYPFFVLVNKCDVKSNTDILDYYKLSEEHFFVSAEQNAGFEQIKPGLQKLETKITNLIPHYIANLYRQKEDDITIKIAIVGKPNAGKSTFVNKLIKQNRLLVSDVPGTTIDAIHIPFKYKGQDFIIIDTAGLRKKTKVVTNSLEHIVNSVSIHSINLANICILMLDATETFSKQDWNIVNTIYAKGKSIILVFNKIDLLDSSQLSLLKREIAYQAEKMIKCYAIYISCKDNINLTSAINVCAKINDLYQQKISTHALNKWLKAATLHRNPTSEVKGKIIKLKYCNRICMKPIVIQIFTNYPQHLTPNYKTYLQSHFINHFLLKGAIVKMKFAKSNNPYSPR